MVFATLLYIRYRAESCFGYCKLKCYFHKLPSQNRVTFLLYFLFCVVFSIRMDENSGKCKNEDNQLDKAFKCVNCNEFSLRMHNLSNRLQSEV